MQPTKSLIFLFFILPPLFLNAQEIELLRYKMKDPVAAEPKIMFTGEPEITKYTGPVPISRVEPSQQSEFRVKKQVLAANESNISSVKTIPLEPYEVKLRNAKVDSAVMRFYESLSTIEPDLKPRYIEALNPRYHDNAVVNIKYYDIEQGLSNSYIYDLHFDKYGMLWIATNGAGVARFDGEDFIYYNRQNGLAHNMVRAIDSDSDGNIWFATMDGVSVFNGRSFRSLTSKNSLKNQNFNDVLVDQNDRIWLAGEKCGVQVLDYGKRITIDTASGLANHINTLYQDGSGRIWIGSQNRGVFCIDGDYLIQYDVDAGLSCNIVRDITGDGKGRIFIASDSGVDIISANKILHYGGQHSTALQTGANVVEFEKKSGLWIGTNGGGLCRINNGRITCLNSNQGLSSDEIWAIERYNSNLIWIGTWGGGVNRYSGFSFVHYRKTQGLPANIVPAISQNQKGEVWFGTFGQGFFKLKDNYFYSYSRKQGFKANVIWSMLFDSSDKLWIATDEQGLWSFDGKRFQVFNKNSGFPANSIWSLLQDRNNNIWIGTKANGLIRFDGKFFTRFALTDQIILSLFEDSKGNIWATTWGDGVYKIMHNRYRHFNHEDGLLADKVYNVFEDEDGYLWFASSGEGLIVYNGKGFESVGQKEGLASDILYWIKKPDAQRILLGSESGLNELILKNTTESTYPDSGFFRATIDSSSKRRRLRIDGREYIIKSYGVNEGFTGHDCIGSQFSALAMPQGDMWIGTGSQLTYYNPAYEIEDTVPPRVHIKSVDLYLQNVDWKALNSSGSTKREKERKIRFDTLDYLYGIPVNLSLPHNKNHLSFDFLGINWKYAHKTLYQYRLLGYETDWNAPTKVSRAVYANLPPGEYTFQVKAMNSDLYWSQPTEYAFIIRTPWWQTWWFQAITLVFLVLLVILLVRLRVKALKDQKRRLERTVKERTQEIMQQKEEIQAQRDTLNQANIQLERLSIVARETHNGVLIADHRGNIEWINEGYTNLLGYSLESLKQKKGLNLFFIHQNENTLEFIKKCRDRKEPVTFNSLFEKENGTEIWLQTTVTPILDDDSLIKKYVVIYGDVTSLKKAQSQIEKHNREITASIRYASRIQSSVLPLRNNIANSELETFILYQPKDIVGGDFYWFSRHHGHYLAGVIDCTGHGVPGAFMTVIAYAVISRIIDDKTASNPAFLLQQMNKHVRQMLKQKAHDDGYSDDGLDASFCYIIPEDRKLIFAGAKQALFHSYSGEIFEIKGDRQSIGYTSSKEDFKYTNKEVEIRQNSIFYLASDGFKDMSLDGDGTILGKKRFRELLESITGKSLHQQHDYLKKIMDKAIARNEQYDDITIFGFKLPHDSKGVNEPSHDPPAGHSREL